MPVSALIKATVAGEFSASEARLQIGKVRAESSLAHFTRMMWSVVEPDRPLIWGWALDAICDHLEAVTDGLVNRLLINVPPGMAKSLLVDVFWPAWEWGPRNMASMRYVAFSYSTMLTKRDNGRFAALINSRLYQSLWGERFKLPPIWGNTKVENDRTGFKFATSVGGVGTGERGDRVIIDDAHNIKDGESQSIRAETVRWFAESITTRMNDPDTSAIVVIMQRVHEDDVSGHIITNDLGYCHLMLPMEFDGRAWKNEIGFIDPRTEEGDLLFPERFPAWVVDRDKRAMGPYSAAGQFQQSPSPRGGGIIKHEWWQVWPPDGWPESKRNNYPPFEFVVASLDTAFTTDEQNDFSALTLWGVFRDMGSLVSVATLGAPSDTMLMPATEHPRAMLIYGWQKRLELHGGPEERPGGLTDAEWMGPAWRALRTKSWGVVEWVVDTCRTYHADLLLIEDKSRGHDVARELKRLYKDSPFGISLVNPGHLDKVSRAYAIQPMFSNGQIYAPVSKAWCETIITQFNQFPKGAHDDLVDTGTQALKWLRDNGLLMLKSETEAEWEARIGHASRRQIPLYDT